MIRVACFVQINTLQPLVKMVSLLRIFRVSFRYFRVTRYLNTFWISPECTAPRKTQKQQDFHGLHQCFLLYWISFPWSRWLWSFSFAFSILREFHIRRFRFIKWKLRESGETKISTILFFVYLQTIRTSALWVSYLSFCTVTPPWLNSVTTWSTVKNLSLIILLKWLGKLTMKSWNIFLNFNRSRVTLTSTQLLQRIHDIIVYKQNVAHHPHTWDTPAWLQQEHLIPHRRNKESKILCCIVWFDEALSEFGSQNSSHKFLDQALSDPKDTTHDLTQKTRILPKLSWASWTRRRTQA